MLVTLRNVFSPQNVMSSLGLLPDLKTSIIDSFYKQRPTHNSPMIGLDTITDVVGTIPVVGRDSLPVPVANEVHDVQFIAPLPVKPSITVTASELNDMKALLNNTYGLENWRKQKIDKLRKIVRDTTEAMASVQLMTGKVNWPRRLSHSSGNYYVDFGSPLTYTPAAKLAATSTITDLWNICEAMAEVINQNGIGGNIEFMAGKEAFAMIVRMAESYKSRAGGHISISLENGKVNVGGHIIHKMTENYPSPADGTWVPKVNPKSLVAVAVEVDGYIWYCAIDSITARNPAVPFYVVPEQMPGDVGIELIGQSKPLPARHPKSVCSAVVVG